MAYSGEPSEGDISSLCDVLAVTRDEAIRRLKANDNNLGNAVNEYFDDPQSTKYRWDESHFNTDREGETNAVGNTFNIQGGDEFPSLSHVNSAAPTRPPSRTNNRSPVGGTTNTSQEDADFARAIAESAAESGISPQEFGVIDHHPNSKILRPTNRSNYNSDMWAIVPTKAMVDSEATNPPPSSRKRDMDAPAFLRQAKTHRLGSLLSIYSKIPLARNVLLRCGKQALTYGHNTEWWKGDAILRPDVLARMAKGEDIWGEDTRPDFTEELHRLVAFLDQSDRSYASADTLTNTKAIDGSYGSWTPDVEDKFFQALQEASTENLDCGIERMITICKVISVAPPVPESSDPDVQTDEEEGPTPCIYLDISLDPDTYSCVSTLYDALDHLLWSSALSLDSSFPEGAKTAVLLKPADILTIRFGSGGLVKPCEIPAVFYADRYMDSHKELALRFQTQIREIKDAVKRLEFLKEERVTCSGQFCGFKLQGFNLGHDVRDCCLSVISYAKELLERQKKDTQWRHFQDKWEKNTPYSMDDLRLIHTWSSPVNSTDEDKANQERLEHIIEACEDKLEEAKRALIAFENKKEELNGYLDVVRKRLTCQEDEADDEQFVFRSDANAYRPEYWNPSEKYLLRGVATAYDITYICVRDEDDASNSGQQAEVKDQWWKVGYIKSDASPIKSEKVTLDDVLQAAGTDCKNPILVYASEAALNEEQKPLSDALRMFVKADNRSFQQELTQEESSREAEEQVQGVAIPAARVMTAATLSQLPSADPKGKRKHSAGSSVATNGSIRSDLADIDLTFTDDNTTLHGNEPVFYDESQPLKLGDVAESLAKCQTDEHERRAEGESQGSGHDPGTTAVSGLRAPEMSERWGGANMFLAQPGNAIPAQNSAVDLMDLDTETENMTV
ncbi:hypothetical protein GGR50DRAFT_640772 [Xylaria sp. CBS 124048]|nr:hypothetical protein GGR50DRAFT_640772 [Xylaria sp. CBS 124048]